MIVSLVSEHIPVLIMAGILGLIICCAPSAAHWQASVPTD